MYYLTFFTLYLGATITKILMKVCIHEVIDVNYDLIEIESILASVFETINGKKDFYNYAMVMEIL
jgi:hypothetical protein